MSRGTDRYRRLGEFLVGAVPETPVRQHGAQGRVAEWVRAVVLRSARPWVNYVPVRADFADLDDAIAFVLENDDRAREIGEAGRRLALSLNLESEIYGMAARL